MNEIMKWKVNQNSSGWFILEMNDFVTFKQFLHDILDRIGTYGKVYVRYGDNTYALTYSFGTITWVSDKIFDRMEDMQVKGGQAHGFCSQVDYHIEIGG